MTAPAASSSQRRQSEPACIAGSGGGTEMTMRRRAISSGVARPGSPGCSRWRSRSLDGSSAAFALSSSVRTAAMPSILRSAFVKTSTTPWPCGAQVSITGHSRSSRTARRCSPESASSRSLLFAAITSGTREASMPFASRLRSRSSSEARLSSSRCFCASATKTIASACASTQRRTAW